MKNYKQNRAIFAGLGLLVIAMIAGGWWYRTRRHPATASISARPKVLSQHRAEVPIIIDTAGATINAAQVELAFDPKQVQAVSVSKDNSLFKLWIDGQPSYSNQAGSISFAGGVPSPGFRGRGQIGSVILTSSRPLTTKLTFADTTEALLNDGLGTKVPLHLAPITVTLP